jgi:hypothetical protein
VTSVQSTGRLIRYEHDFVDASSIDEEFFDPASLGYEEPDPVAAITKPSPDFTAYWLGPDSSFDDLPPLTIRDAFVISGANRPELRYRATVTYRAIDDEFSPALLEVQQWRSDEWALFEGFLMSAWREDACVHKIELTGKAWSATLFAGFSVDLRDSADVPCPDTDANRYIATVDLGSTVIRITAPEGSPFNSEEAMREVIKALKAAN